MTETPQPSGKKQPRARLLWVLGFIAVIATGVAAYSWSQGQTADDPPTTVSLDDLAAGNLGATDPAPDFTVPTLDGGRFTLSQHLADTDQPLVLNLWASWCAPCRAEMPALDAAAARHEGVTFLGVAVQDDLQAAEEFATELGIQYPIGLDERDEVNALYPTLGLPVTYLISAEGSILQPIYGGLDAEKIDSLLATWFGG